MDRAVEASVPEFDWALLASVREADLVYLEGYPSLAFCLAFVLVVVPGFADRLVQEGQAFVLGTLVVAPLFALIEEMVISVQHMATGLEFDLAHLETVPPERVLELLACRAFGHLSHHCACYAGGTSSGS